MDLETIGTALLVVGAGTVLLALRRLGAAEDDVAVVVASIAGTPIEPERPHRAEPEEPMRWRPERLRPRAADR
jgi:hypothetical protein